MSEFKTKIDTFVLVPSTGGCFELTLNGDLIYSKLETGKFPEETSMVAEVGKRLL